MNLGMRIWLGIKKYIKATNQGKTAKSSPKNSFCKKEEMVEVAETGRGGSGETKEGEGVQIEGSLELLLGSGGASLFDNGNRSSLLTGGEAVLDRKWLKTDDDLEVLVGKAGPEKTDGWLASGTCAWVGKGVKIRSSISSVTVEPLCWNRKVICPQQLQTMSHH